MDDFNNDYQPEIQKPILKNELADHDSINGGGSGLAITSLVLGIISVVLCWGCGINIITAIVGLVMGIVSMAQRRNNMGIAIAGLVTSGLGLLLGIAVVLLAFLSV